jgi:hypothetical protein
MLEQDIRS